MYKGLFKSLLVIASLSLTACSQDYSYENEGNLSLLSAAQSTTTIVGPTTAAVGETVQFSLSIPSGESYDWISWNFGSGPELFDHTNAINHVFTEAGDYEIEVILEPFNEEYITITHLITVTEADQGGMDPPGNGNGSNQCEPEGSGREFFSESYVESVACGENGLREVTYRDEIYEECLSANGGSLSWVEISRDKIIVSEGECVEQNIPDPVDPVDPVDPGESDLDPDDQILVAQCRSYLREVSDMSGRSLLPGHKIINNHRGSLNLGMYEELSIINQRGSIGNKSNGVGYAEYLRTVNDQRGSMRISAGRVGTIIDQRGSLCIGVRDSIDLIEDTRGKLVIIGTGSTPAIVNTIRNQRGAIIMLNADALNIENNRGSVFVGN